MTSINFISLIVCLIVAVFGVLALAILYKVKTGVSIKTYLVGALCFTVFVTVLEGLVHSVCIAGDNSLSRIINGSVILYMLYGAFMAGIFEEMGRWFGFRFLLRKHKDASAAIGYGIGHGGIEVWLLVVANYLLILLVGLGVSLGDPTADAMMLTAGASITPGVICLVLFERVAAVILHIGLSCLVFTSVNRKGMKHYLPIAIFLHAIADMPAALFQKGMLPMWFTEAWIFVLAVAVCFYGLRLLRKTA